MATLTLNSVIRSPSVAGARNDAGGYEASERVRAMRVLIAAVATKASTQRAANTAVPSLARRQVGESNRLARRRAAAKREAPPPNIVPGAELKADFRIGRYLLETHRLMQADALFIGQGDAGKGGVEALACERLKKTSVERPADAPTMDFGCGIDSDVHRPAIGRSFPMLRRVGVGDNGIAVFENQEGMGGERLADAAAHLVRRGRNLFEGDGSVPHIGGVNASHR